MRLLRAVLLSVFLTSVASAAILPGRLALGFFSQPSGGGQTLVFNYASGFTGAHSAFVLNDGDVSFSDPIIITSNCTSGAHHAGIAYYGTRLNISSFQTEFTFQIKTGYGLTLIIQNDPKGTATGADANGMSYMAYSSNAPLSAIQDSVGLNFNATPNVIGSGTATSVVGLYVDGGNEIDNGVVPVQDMAPQGITVGNNDVMDALLTYDGTDLTLLLTDTTTSAKAYFSWPVNIPSILGSSTAYVGAGGGCLNTGTEVTFNSWVWYNGINTELSGPTFSPAPGAYTTSQTVSISGPSGATIYYTTNGKPPTTASSVYSTPLTVSSNEFVQAIAVKANYTNSPVVSGAYLVQSSGSPTINFPSGFSGAAGLLNIAGAGDISASTLQITNGSVQYQEGSAFYVAPVPISTFSASFTIDSNSGTPGSHNGMMYVIENPGLTGYNPLSFTFSGPLTSATGATVSSTTSVGGVPWGGYLSGQSFPQNMEFSDGVTRAVTITNGSANVTWTTPYTCSSTCNAYFIQAPNTVISGEPYSLGQGSTHDGYPGIGQSVAVDFSFYNQAVGIATDGGSPTLTTITGGINMGVNPLLCTLTYNGTTLSLTIEDTVTHTTFGPVNWTVDIPTIVGASTAYVGFTGSAADSNSANEVTAWTQ